MSLVGPAVRPEGAGRVGDVQRGGGKGWIIRQGTKQPLYALGVARDLTSGKSYTVLTSSYDEASWWRHRSSADLWAAANLLPRRGGYDVASVAFPGDRGV